MLCDQSILVQPCLSPCLFQVWEAVCWRRGSFRFKYASMVIRKARGEGEGGHAAARDAKAVKEGEEPTEMCPVSCELLEEAYEALRLMIRAQGPVQSDLDEPSAWTKPARGDDETATLLHHGIYSSAHLLALKQMAEVAYWRWSYFPDPEWLAVAERTLREFVFVGEKVIPERGWTAEWERGRVKELQAVARSQKALVEGEEGSSTEKVLQEEFGSMDLQQEIDHMKKEHGEDKQRTRSRSKKNNKKKR